MRKVKLSEGDLNAELHDLIEAWTTAVCNKLMSDLPNKLIKGMQISDGTIKKRRFLTRFALVVLLHRQL